MKLFTFKPDWGVPPGETIQECLDAKQMTQDDLAKRMRRPLSQVNRLINGRIRLTAMSALDLERVLKCPAEFWMNLESQWQLHLARKLRKGKKAS